MQTMRNVVIILLLLLIGIVVIMPLAATAAPTESPTPTLTQSTTRALSTPVKVTIAPIQKPHPPFGEVVYPVIRYTPTPSITRTPTPIIQRTLVATTLTPLRTPIPATPETLRTTIQETPTPSRTTVSATPTVSGTTIPITQTTLPATVSATPTVSSTTIPVTQTTTVPVVTVTVYVYPSGPFYRPAYYYPAGYYYDSSSYYPPYYPYDVNAYYSSGSLTVTSNPPEATAILDGYNSEITPYIFTGLTTGYHTLEVNYPGYETYVTNVYIDNGANVEIYADLTELTSYGSFYIDSTPQGADVYVDGNYQGSSPVTVGAMSVGAHQIELHLAGYEVLQTTENVAAGQGTVVNLAMVPYSSSSEEGSIDVTSNMPGALVYLDGIYKGAIQPDNSFDIIAVSPGSHNILLHLPGYTDFSQAVQVNAGQISNVNAVLTPESPPTSAAATGTIIVTSSPTGGQVYVDNQLRGAAPVTIYNVAAGTHIINIKLTGYSDWSSSVNVPVNQVAQVSATLTKGSGTVSVTPSIGLSMFAIIGGLAIVTVVLSFRIRK
jgi:hypothetical protein